MADARFFKNTGSITLKHLTEITGASVFCDTILELDSASVILQDVAPLNKASHSDISFLDNIKYLETLKSSHAGVCFIQEKYKHHAPDGMIMLLTPEPYRDFALAAAAFYPDVPPVPEIAPTAQISPSASIGKNCTISAYAVIGNHVVIGDNCTIGASTSIADGVVIGNDSMIGSHSTISHSLIGDSVIIHRGVHIGQDGFGFALGKTGHIKVPQLGRVIIGDKVEIGSGTCIDRGSTQDTVIGAGTKIDNIVQIGHNVQIGNHCIIVAQAAIAGSTHIGNGVLIAGQAGIAGHLKIGNGAKIAAKSGVLTDIPDGIAYGGLPAVPVKQWHRQTVAIARLAERKDKPNE